MSRVVALVQARMSSTRFPGKVLAELAGVPSIVFMLRRARMAKRLDDVILVTSTDASDDALAATVTEYDFPVFRGDLHDVLARYRGAAEQFGADEVVRLTGDCPLVDPGVIDAVIEARRAAGVVYASNVDPPTFPDGLDVECFTRGLLEAAFERARAQSEREHVTLWMRSEAAAIERTNVRAVADLSHLRLTVDYPDDLLVVRRVVNECGANADMFDVLRCLSRHPELMDLNAHARNEGLAKSIAADTSR